MDRTLGYEPGNEDSTSSETTSDTNIFNTFVV